VLQIAPFVRLVPTRPPPPEAPDLWLDAEYNAHPIHDVDDLAAMVAWQLFLPAAIPRGPTRPAVKLNAALFFFQEPDECTDGVGGWVFPDGDSDGNGDAAGLESSRDAPDSGDYEPYQGMAALLGPGAAYVDHGSSAW
jgi:hypothetical protein